MPLCSLRDLAVKFDLSLYGLGAVSLLCHCSECGGLPYPVDGQLFRLRLKDSTEMAGAGCKARLGPLGHLLFI
jgi:hypothetical protein